MKKSIMGSSLLVLLWANGILAGPSKWSSVTIFDQAPLEVKLGTFSDDMNSDLLTMVLWNDGSMNRLDAVRVPFPYDGSNVTSTALESTPTLFSLGDTCRMGSNIIVPYIKNFNVEIALFNGMNMSWSNITIPETIGHSFDSADCAVSQDGLFVSGHDFNDSEIEIFKLNPNLTGFTFYGRYGGGGTPATDIAGPFNGGVRDTLVMARDGSFSMSMYQAANGMIRTAQFDSSAMTPSFTHTDVAQETAPTGFTFVKESFGVRLQGRVVFGYNANSRAEVIEIEDSNPLFPQTLDLGQINNVGSQFNFQGGAFLANLNGDGGVAENIVLWDKYYHYDPETKQIEIDAGYPLNGVGGPVATCRREHNDFESELFVVGPKVGFTGTDFHVTDLESLDTIFTDGFESGDTSVWSYCP